MLGDEEHLVVPVSGHWSILNSSADDVRVQEYLAMHPV
jgi:hypothetical protein